MLSFTDQMGHTISPENPPQRIISLVPSQTELLADLGLEDEVVGITKFCIHPENWFRTKTRIGGTKQFNFEKIAALKPDLIIGNKEENEKEQIEKLMADYPVWMSDIRTLDQACNMILELGKITNRAEKSKAISDEIILRFQTLKNSLPVHSPKKVAYFIWKNPWMVAGGNTFIDQMLGICNWQNVFSENGRYPEITLDDLKKADPEIVLLSSEPYPFKEKHIAELLEVLPVAKILTVDGEMFSWYGTRLLQAPQYFLKLVQDLNLR
jgi:ABC-type Fe3+-hydroxamate transport system substrate-binding protein